MAPEATVRKNSKQIHSQVEKVTVQNLITGFRTVTLDNKYQFWAFVDLLFLIKKIILDDFY